ncbi:MAG TPA: porin [Pseudoxanthomonas sp.]|nr:porin [Pseudoxanthomonas sp.]
MKTSLITSMAILALQSAPASAQIAIDTIGGSDLTLEGLIQADANWYDSDVADLDGDPDDGSDADYQLRTAQIYLKGKGPGQFDWVLGYDAKADKWLDANARYKFGEGRQFVQVGQFKQPNGLEELSAAKHNDFMSLAMITNTFTVGRRLGAAYSMGHPYDRTSGNPDGGFARHGNWGVTVSYFGRELTRNLAHGSGYGVRGTWALMNAEKRILHFGLSYVDHDTPADTQRLRARPNADLTPVRLVDTGSMTDTDRVSTLGLESFWVHGPFKLQGEYMTTRVNRMESQDFSGTGGYVSGVWNVAGQTWGYKGGEPAMQVGDATGAGVWQLGLRYDVLDLNDNAVTGGRMETWTAGVNWYWRKHFKVVLNYVHVDSERAGFDDNPAITEARMQFYW